MTEKKTRVELWIHRTSGIEFELIDADTKKVIMDRVYVCDEDDEDAEEVEMNWVMQKISKAGWEFAGTVWS